MFGIFDLLDNILPSTDRSNHGTLRLEYMSACNIMKNYNCIINLLPRIPASFFDSLLKSAIYPVAPITIRTYASDIGATGKFVILGIGASRPWDEGGYW